MRVRIVTLLLTLVIGGCALIQSEQTSEPGTESEDVSKGKQDDMESQPLKYLSKHKLKPMPITPLTANARCSFRDEVSGARGKLDLLVTDNLVKRFSAEVDIPKHGVCRFNFKEFEQADKKKNPITLKAKSGVCAVNMWKQARQVTVAFNECSDKCEGDAFEYLWPILIDSKTGRCK